MIAMALAMDPALLLADEPTTALDVTVQAQIMSLLRKLQESRGTAIVLITHDLGVVAGHADRVLVMYAGRVAETAGADALFHAPRHRLHAGAPDEPGPPRPAPDRPAATDPRPTAEPDPRAARLPVPPPLLVRHRDLLGSEVPPLVGGASHAAACHHQDRVAEARAAVIEA